MSVNREIIDFDPVTGIKETFHHNIYDGEFTIETTQDVTDILDFNAAQRNMLRSKRNRKFSKEGSGMTHVMRMDLVTYYELERLGFFADEKSTRKVLDDPAFAKFRTIDPGIKFSR